MARAWGFFKGRFGVFLVTTLVLYVVGGLLESNIVQGDYTDKYGDVKVPGSKVVHLPSGTTEVAFAAFLLGAGNETPDMPIPKHLELDVQPVDPGVAAPAITRDVGTSSNSSADDTNTDIRIWKVDIPEDGDYKVTARGGDFRLVNPTLELGTGPLVPIGYVILGAVVIGLIAAFAWPLVSERIHPGKGPDSNDDDHHAKYGLDWDRSA
jgi:hypothetical protein